MINDHPTCQVCRIGGDHDEGEEPPHACHHPGGNRPAHHHDHHGQMAKIAEENTFCVSVFTKTLNLALVTLNKTLAVIMDIQIPE